MELLIDPLLEAHLLDALDVAWPRAVAEAIERVQNGLVLGEFGDGQLALELRIETGIERGWRWRLVAAGGGAPGRRLGVSGKGRPAERRRTRAASNRD